MSAHNKLSGLSAIVTGASRGVGKGIALELARAGCRVAVNNQPSGTLADQTVGDILDLGVDACAVQADVGVASDVDGMFDQAAPRWWRIDVLVNNAGIQTWTPFVDVTEAEW